MLDKRDKMTKDAKATNLISLAKKIARPSNSLFVRKLVTVERRISQIFLRLLTDTEIIMLQSNFELSLRTSQKQENCIDVGPVIKHFLLHNKRYAFLIGTFTTHCRIALQCTVQSFVTLDSYYDRVYVNSLLFSHLVIFNQ